MAVDNLEVSPVTEAAKALAEALKNDARFTDWRELGAAVEKNEGLKTLLIRFQQLAQKAQIAQQGGPQLTEAEVAEIQDLQKNLQEDVLFNRHNQATGALLEMLQSANEALSEGIGLDFAGNVAAAG